MAPKQIKANAPKGASHYKVTKDGVTVRYYAKDHNGKWGIYQDWKCPIGWKLCTIFENTDEFKPL